MTGEEVPQDVLDAAQRGYSMHGAGLTANIVAAAWPAIEKHIRDRTPTGGLRERLVEALTREHYRRARERIEASPEEHCAAFADAVLPVVQDALAHARASCCEDGDRTYAEMERHLTQRAEEAERERDDYRQRFANQMTAATELTTTLREAERKLQQARDAIADERRGRLAAEAAVRRARAVVDEALPDWEDTRAYHRERADRKGYSHDEAVAETSERAIKVMTDVLAALDADQPKETPTCCWFDGDRCMTHGTDQLKEDGT